MWRWLAVPVALSVGTFAFMRTLAGNDPQTAPPELSPEAPQTLLAESRDPFPPVGEWGRSPPPAGREPVTIPDATLCCVRRGQLLALIDPARALADLQTQLSKLHASHGEFLAAGKAELAALQVYHSALKSSNCIGCMGCAVNFPTESRPTCEGNYPSSARRRRGARKIAVPRSFFPHDVFGPVFVS
jgi:hypothetical protein